MSSMRKSTRRASRCMMPNICSAPSETRTVVAAPAGAAALDGVAAPPRLVSFSAVRVPEESSPENRRLKKQRNASRIRFKQDAPKFKDSSGQAGKPAPLGFTSYLQAHEECAARHS